MIHEERILPVEEMVAYEEFTDRRCVPGQPARGAPPCSTTTAPCVHPEKTPPQWHSEVRTP